MEGTRQGKPITLGGVAYISITAACLDLAPRLKISRRQLEVRIRKGWPEKHILHVGPLGNSPGAWDHLGRHYRNEPEMCKAWGVRYETYRKRRTRGMGIEAALTYVKRHRPTVDHTGRRFPTFRAMCAAWGQPEKRAAKRLAKGWRLERALTAPPRKPWDPVPCTDHTGRQFPSQGAMCEAWGIAQGLVCNRIRCMGWSLERALTTPVRHPWGMKED